MKTPVCSCSQHWEQEASLLRMGHNNRDSKICCNGISEGMLKRIAIIKPMVNNTTWNSVLISISCIHTKTQTVYFPASSVIRWLCVSARWLSSSMISHHTSALCASCFWLLSASNRGKAFGPFGAKRWLPWKQTPVCLSSSVEPGRTAVVLKNGDFPPLTQVVYKFTPANFFSA